MPGYTVRFTHHVNAATPADALAAAVETIAAGTASFEVSTAEMFTPSGAWDVTPARTRSTERRRRRTPASLITLPERSVISTDLYATPDGEEECVYNDFVFSLGNGALVDGFADTVGFWPGSYATGVVTGPRDERLTMTMSLIDQARLAGWDVAIVDYTGLDVSDFDGYAAYPRVAVDTVESDCRASLHSLSTLAASRTTSSSGHDHTPVLVVIAGLSQCLDHARASTVGTVSAVVDNLVATGPGARIHTIVTEDTLSDDTAALLAGRVSFAVVNSAESGMHGTGALVEAAGMDVAGVEDTISRMVAPQPAGLFLRLTEAEVTPLAPFAVYTPASDGPARLTVAGQESQWEDVRRLLDSVDAVDA